MSVSVCIPTFRRPKMLRECIESCFSNTIRPLEIVVSDDDADPAVQAMLEAMTPPEGIAIVYTANRLGKGQAANVNSAFQTASHSRLVLIHDDDFFLSGGIDHLSHAWTGARDEIDACYGFQAICDNDGTVDEEATSSNNHSYYRRDETIGAQDSPLWAALVAQFPNNGYMIRKSIALEVGYPMEAEVGRIPVDLHFGIRYAQASKRPFVLIPERTTAYRKSDASILRSRDSRLRPQQLDAQLGWVALASISPHSSEEWGALSLALDRAAPGAIASALYAGQLRRALQIARHKDVSWPRGMIDLAKAGTFLSSGVWDRLRRRA